MKIALCVYVFIILFIVILEYTTINKKNILPPRSLECSDCSRLTHSMLTVRLLTPPKGLVQWLLTYTI